MTKVIDVWNIDTFDVALSSFLIENRQRLSDYFCQDRKNYLEREASDGRQLYPDNPYAALFYMFAEEISRWMNSRCIRAWHYTRLTDSEVEIVRREGVHLSSINALKSRLDSLVFQGELRRKDAQLILASSPLRSDKFDSRSGMFWMTSHPLNVEYTGVKRFLAHWGGESAHFCHEEGLVLDLLSKIGKPRVIEMSVPLSSTRHAYRAAEAIIANFARSVGCHAERSSFDLSAHAPLGPETLIRVHTLGEAEFSKIARGYPATFNEES
jgi:hypothetical protein